MAYISIYRSFIFVNQYLVHIITPATLPESALGRQWAYKLF